MMDRRAFLVALLGSGLGGGVARTYFDVGPAWQRHASGLVVPDTLVGVDVATGMAIRFVRQWDVKTEWSNRMWVWVTVPELAGSIVAP
jgi:hypothetical protein